MSTKNSAGLQNSGTTDVQYTEHHEPLAGVTTDTSAVRAVNAKSSATSSATSHTNRAVDTVIADG